MFTPPTPEQIAPVTGKDDRDLYPGEGFVALEIWEGYVHEVTDETFFVRLMDKDSGHPEIEAEVFRSVLCAEDNERVHAGDSFDWAIGHWEEDPDKRQMSYLRLRDLPPLTEEDLADARRRADELIRKLGWDQDSQSKP